MPSRRTNSSGPTRFTLKAGLEQPGSPIDCISAVRHSQPRLLWGLALGASFLLSVFAAFRGGYVGPDYNIHLARLIEWPRIFDFSTTSPPTYYLLGHGLFGIIGSNNAFPITLSIIQAAINCVAIWYFFRYIERRFQSPVVQLALVLFLTFLPVRVIHATTIGTDCTTIPLFVLLLFLFDNFLVEKISTSKNAAVLGLGLALAVCTKYSFMALLPAVLLVVAFLAKNQGWSFEQLITIWALSLTVPLALSVYSFWASGQVHGYNTEKHWLQEGMPPDMNYKDLFSVKASDAQLFRAPEYFKREILTAHKHSYLGLSHMGIFTDPMNLFQDLSVAQTIGSVLIPDQKTRRPWKTGVMAASMSLGTIWTLLALLGTASAFWQALKNLSRNNLQREDSAILLGIAYFLLMFLPIPFVHAGALFGYWTPRLILPALLCFFMAGFILIDRKLAEKSNKIVLGVLLLVAIQCAAEIAILI
jgi:4-amino-4-deoxy-L-arabinose transferase-like glycosyltransferase